MSRFYTRALGLLMADRLMASTYPTSAYAPTGFVGAHPSHAVWGRDLNNKLMPWPGVPAPTNTPQRQTDPAPALAPPKPKCRKCGDKYEGAFARCQYCLRERERTR